MLQNARLALASSSHPKARSPFVHEKGKGSDCGSSVLWPRTLRLNAGKFVFEFVAICTNDVEKGRSGGKRFWKGGFKRARSPLRSPKEGVTYLEARYII